MVKKILVVEDNELNMKLIDSLLKLGHYETVKAADAETGIRLARGHNPDLVLMDIQLPGMDGLHASRIIKTDPELKNIPVVALTAHAMVGDEDRAREAGCDGYLAKPIDTRTFLQTIAQYLHGNNVNGQVEENAQDHIRGHQHKILIVDDDPLNLELLSQVLCSEEFEVVLASDGVEALDKVVQESPDLILLDIMMPVLDGLEVTRRLKGDPDFAHIPIVLVTGLDDAEHKMKGLEAGANEFLSKPIDSVELRARIRSLLDLKNYREQLTARSESKPLLLATAQDDISGRDEASLPTLILVEDNEKDAKLIRALLREESLHIEVVNNGKQAIQRAKEGNVDLMLLDVLLPDMNGFEICRLLKETGVTRNIQIVMVTSLSGMENRIKGLELGADDYLLKPVNERELKVRIKALLKKKAFLDNLTSNYNNALNCAITDRLTGLYNYAYFRHFLSLETKRSTRRKDPVSLLMLDLDDFKQVNDTLGHLVGDAMLAEFAELLTNSSREVDFVARYGGEEFAIVLPYTGAEGAMKCAEHIRKRVENHAFSCSPPHVQKKVTASLGIATFPWDASDVDELIRKADLALYQAKKQGKNCVCVYANGHGHGSAESYRHNSVTTD
jgi:two-component system cell cycle response regulator